MHVCTNAAWKVSKLTSDWYCTKSETLYHCFCLLFVLNKAYCINFVLSHMDHELRKILFPDNNISPFTWF